MLKTNQVDKSKDISGTIYTQLVGKLMAEDSDSGTESSSQALRKRHACRRDGGGKKPL